MTEVSIRFGVLTLAIIVTVFLLSRYSPEGSILRPGAFRMRQAYAEFGRQHQAGWIVLLDGVRIAELEYHHYEDNVFVFTLKLLTADQTKIDEVFKNAMARDPDPRITFENRRFAVCVPDGPILSHIWDERTAVIRDFRVPPE